MKLVIAEKPSAAQSYAKALNITAKKSGYFEGNGYIITWCIGHLAGLADAAAYDEKYAVWKYEDLPILPEKWQFAINKGKENQYKVVSGLMNRNDITEIINGCDAGREGELIFRFVYNMCGCKKPYFRLWISSMEESAIREGFNNLKDGREYDNLYNSALCRAKADWIIGINATRLFTSLYRKHLNIGRVQTPTLAMIAERDSKISMFRKEKYYTVEIDGGNIKAVSDKISDKDEAQNLQAACHERQAVCISAVKEKKKTGAPKLFDLTTLQREANRIFGYTAKQTLDYAQSLYEKKLITYPGTDSRYLTDDMHNTVMKIVHIASKFAPFSNCTDFKPDTFCLFNNEKVSDHHAIIPTAEIENISLAEIPNGESNILHLIMCKLLCAVNSPYEYETITAVLECGGVQFTAKGKIILFEGWKNIEQLFKRYIHSDTDRAEDVFCITKGETVTVSSEVKEGYTSPPKAFTEDTLLSSMETAGAAETTDEAERKGLGTPATRAAIIEKLVQTGFAERKGKSIVATHNGISLVSVLPEKLTSPILTSDWENNLAEIAKGNYPPEQFMKGIEDLTRELVTTYSFITDEDRAIFRAPREVIGICPRCGSDVHESKNNFYCANKSCKFVMWKNDRFFTSKRKEITKKMASDLLAKGRTKVKGLYSEKKDKTYDADVVLIDSNDKYVHFRLDFDGK